MLGNEVLSWTQVEVIRHVHCVNLSVFQRSPNSKIELAQRLSERGFLDLYYHPIEIENILLTIILYLRYLSLAQSGHSDRGK